MEARSLFENSEMREITVSATPEEWRQVIDQLNGGGWKMNKYSESLVYWLINQGVYDQ